MRTAIFSPLVEFEGRKKRLRIAHGQVTNALDALPFHRDRQASGLRRAPLQVGQALRVV